MISNRVKNILVLTCQILGVYYTLTFSAAIGLQSYNFPSADEAFFGITVPVAVSLFILIFVFFYCGIKAFATLKTQLTSPILRDQVLFKITVVMLLGISALLMLLIVVLTYLVQASEGAYLPPNDLWFFSLENMSNVLALTSVYYFFELHKQNEQNQDADPKSVSLTENRTNFE